MKKLAAVIALTLVLGIGTTIAQQKFGHINSQELLLAMSETKQMQTALETKQKDYNSQLEKMYIEYEGKAKELEQNGSSMMDAILEAKVQDLKDLQKRIQQFEQKAQDDLMKLEEQLSTPILEKARVAIKSVADEKGYTYVFDLASGALVHYPETDDLTSLVKGKLNIN